MFKKVWFRILITLLLSCLVYYFTLPALNLQSPGFWMFVGSMVFVYFLITLFGTMDGGKAADYVKLDANGKVIFTKEHMPFSKVSKSIIIVGVIIVGIFLVNFVVSPLFNAKGYSQRIVVDETREFTEDVAEVNFKAIPLLDKASSQKLGDRTMGQMADLVSQFYVSDIYTQINYNSDIVRVTPLEYADWIKYFTNRKEGVKGYITVNSVNGDSKLVRLDKGMKYMPSALFFENLDRKLRLLYPFEIFDRESFEIDNEGNPYWIIPTVKYTGVGMKKEISGVVILNPVTGEHHKYKVGEVPSWIDHVFESELIVDQVNNWGEYKNGFWNSIFGQKNVINTTEGYTYLAMEDDIYLYTGITSVSTDESNLGFILTNMRTKETHFYAVPGAEEFSAMASAEGLVQEKSYIATFPLLINLNNKPTYLLSLKDNAGLVKMYAFVDVVDYQKVITSDASLGIETAAKKYLAEQDSDDVVGDVKETTMEIKKIKTAVIDGVTHYYLVDKDNNNYVTSVKTNKNLLPFLEVGNKVNVSYVEDKSIRTITIIEKK